MRKNIWIIVIGLVIFSACKSSQTPQSIGGDKDRHGCLTAAGYTWSELRRDCIRVFEDGVRINDPALPSSVTSYAVFAADSSRVEVFRPSPFRNEMLKRQGDVWQGKSCKLFRSGKGWELREK